MRDVCGCLNLSGNKPEESHPTNYKKSGSVRSPTVACTDQRFQNCGAFVLSPQASPNSISTVIFFILTLSTFPTFSAIPNCDNN